MRTVALVWSNLPVDKLPVAHAVVPVSPVVSTVKIEPYDHSHHRDTRARVLLANYTFCACCTWLHG